MPPDSSRSFAFRRGHRAVTQCVLIALAVVAIHWISGCSKSSTRPSVPGDPYLEGQVLDASGAPVENAYIGVQFLHLVALQTGAKGGGTKNGSHPRSVPLEVPNNNNGAAETRLYRCVPNPFSGQTRLNFALRWPMPVDLEILRRDRTLVRALVTRHSLPAGLFSIAWDGRDDANHVLPNDVYIVRLTAGAADTAIVRESRVTLQNQAGARDAISDSRGRFRIPLARLPLGEKVVETNSNGDSLGVFYIARQVVVCASRPGSAASECSPPIELGDGSRSVSVTVRLP